MENPLQKIPFFRLTLCFSIGIIASEAYNFSIPYYVLPIYLLGIFLFISRNFNSRLFLYQFYTFLLSIFLMLAGYIYAENYNQQPQFRNGEFYLATILEKPIPKEKSFKSELLIKQVYCPHKHYQTNEKMIAYFAKDCKVHNLRAGDKMLFKSKPAFVTNKGNPFEFDYKNYLARKRIYRQVYIPSHDYKTVAIEGCKPLRIFAKQLREKLLNIYRENHITDDEFAILSALTLGYKDELDKDVKNVFSSAGAMHVLAVSGLHVGIIYLIINFLFGFLKKRRIGRHIFMVLSIILLWIYALITGFSPSVLRAATMFSFIVIGENLRRPCNIYNTLSASAFFLLVLNPNLIFEVGFQLSYCAVIGIVFFQPKFHKLFQFNYWATDKLWGLFTVSLAAQLATFPFSIYYFNQFPTYAWLSNFIVIPAAFLFIYLSMGVLLFSSIPLISEALGNLISYLIHLFYSLLSGFKNLPNYLIEDIYISLEQLYILFGTLIFLMLLIKYQKPRYISFVLVSVCLFTCINVLQEFKAIHQKEIIIYNADKTKLIHLIDGKKNYILSDSPITEKTIYLIKTVQLNMKLEPPIFIHLNQYYKTSNLYVSPHIILFHGYSILYNPNLSLSPQLPIDAAICNSIGQTKIIQAQTFISSNSKIWSTSNNKNFHPLLINGAYLVKLQ